MRLTPAWQLLLYSMPTTRGKAFTDGPFGGGIPCEKRMMRNCTFLMLGQESFRLARNAERSTATRKCAPSAEQVGRRYLLLGSASPMHQEGQKSHSHGAAKSSSQQESCGFWWIHTWRDSA